MSSVNKESEAVTVLNDSLPLDAAQTSLESNLNQLSLETLRFVCQESLEKGSVTGKGKEGRPQFMENYDDTLSEDLEGTVGQNFQSSCAWDRKAFGYGAELGPLFLEDALASGDMNYVCLARQVTLERAWVADEDS
ncbi:14865_t:CDS:2 [Racocetra fulgida]|uniref:14865_t:CDS:1 n=1 Tax=Racocetra fulgida TaxID=60492 RepID=A0A9N9FII8_9GLOM|nr:14865_t:CDS:2 [Racocetra fulgida]